MRRTKDVAPKGASPEESLELSMVFQRAWSGAQFRDCLLSASRAVGVVFTLASRESGRRTAMLAAPGELVDDAREPVEIGAGDRLRVAHRSTLDDGEVAAWSSLLSERGISQPFVQLAREVRSLRENELDAVYLWRWMGSSIRRGSLGNLVERGWRKGGWGRVKPIDGTHFFELRMEGLKFREVKITDGTLPVTRTFRSCGVIPVSELLLDLETLGLQATF